MQSNEHHRARQWRDRHGLSTRELAELTGYSVEAIFWFEKGLTPPNRNAKGGRAKDRKHKAWVMLRYRLACAAIDQQLRTGKTFDW
jgi:DNA-binding XRE family transcriptional regulator